MVPLPSSGVLVGAGSSVVLSSPDEPKLIWTHAPGILSRLAPEPPVVVISLDSESDSDSEPDGQGTGGCRALYFPTPVWRFGRLARYWWNRSQNTTIHLLTREMAKSYRHQIRYPSEAAGRNNPLPPGYLVKMACRPAWREALIVKSNSSLNRLMGDLADACLWCGLAVKLDFQVK